MSDGSVKIAALYRFCRLPDHADLRAPLLSVCRREGIKGTLLLAGEGINGTVAGWPSAIDTLVAWLDTVPALRGAEIKYSFAGDMPFHRLKVRLKKEIVTMGAPDVDPLEGTGAYVDPADWNALIADENTVVIDTRNAYEIAIGTFDRAIDPQMSTFREFPDWVERNHNMFAGKKVAMFCTGGIRCEKATAYVRSLGFGEVYHLRGGILKYLEEIPLQDSLWRGECFVFDERVSVGHGLEKGKAELCRACRHPLTTSDRASARYLEGISCPHCHDQRSEEDRGRYAERHRQAQLAEARGRRHIGEKA